MNKRAISEQLGGAFRQFAVVDKNNRSIFTGGVPRFYTSPAASLFGPAPPGTVYAAPAVTSEYPPQFAAALAAYPRGVGLSKETLAEFNRAHRDNFLRGTNFDEAVYNYIPVTKKDIFNMLAIEDPTGAWIQNVDLASWTKGSRALYERRPDGKLVRDAEGNKVLNRNISEAALQKKLAARLKRTSTRVQRGKTAGLRVADFPGGRTIPRQTLTLASYGRAGGAFAPRRLQ